VPPEHFGLLADAVLLLHAMFVAFVVIGLLLILLGLCRDWRWVRNPWFRTAHLSAIGIVVAQAWAGVMCPLTVWESELRLRAGQAGYEGSFIGHWIGRLLYYEAEPWVFTVLYTLFGALVIGVWLIAPPRRPR
jgi:multisubunit Na+/H+ antiporter MnhB subunit